MTPDPTPQPPDHGAAGFCTDHGQPPDERTETVARVLREHSITSGYDWNEESYSYCRCGAQDVGPAHQAAAVVAALDPEEPR